MVTRREFLGSTLTAAAMVACGPLVRSVRRRTVVETFTGLPTIEGAGVRLTRLVGQPGLRHLDPFILLDRFHSADPADYARGFPDHPHRGFETITVMLDGEMRHRDSRGNHGVIGGGGIQWMTAGRGIVHSEMPVTSTGLLSGFQFWLNLPAREKWRTPEYQDLVRDEITHVALPSGGELALIAGRTLDVRGPVAERATAPVLLTMRLEDDAPVLVDLPEGHSAFAYVHDGECVIGGRAVAAGELALLGDGNVVEVRARAMRSALVLAAGKPLGEPIVQRGPFVMNTEAEIQQAFADYRAGRLAL